MPLNMRVLIFGLILALPSLSMAWPHRLGLITDDYGIVSDQDLDEEEYKVDATPFPPSEMSPFQYWQCLPTSDVFMKCDDLGFTAPEFGGAEVGESVLNFRTNGEVFNFFTRRNNSLKSCEDMIDEWRSVMAGEDVVCISASYQGTEAGTLRDSTFVNKSEWEIDRMKSRHGEWSWFKRSPSRESSQD